MMKYIDWNQLSELGLQERINREILHPLGLALFRTSDGVSNGALIEEGDTFEYSKDIQTKIISNEKVLEKIKVLSKKDTKDLN